SVRTIVVARPVPNVRIDEEVIRFVCECLRPGVMAQELKAIAESLIEPDLQRIVTAGRLVRVIAEVLCPSKWGTVLYGKCLTASVEIWTSIILCICCRHATNRTRNWVDILRSALGTKSRNRWRAAFIESGNRLSVRTRLV